MRIWSSSSDHDGSIHVIGNGNMIAYGIGPNILHLEGPPYSAPQFLSMNIDCNAGEILSSSEREDHTAIWKHRISIDNKNAFEINDYMLSSANILVREYHTIMQAKFYIQLGIFTQGKVLLNGFYSKEKPYKTLLLTIPKGSTFFTNESINHELTMGIVIFGEGCIDFDGIKTAEITIPEASNSRLIFCSGTYPEVINGLEYAANSDFQQLKSECFEYWYAFSARRYNFNEAISDNNPYKVKILEAIDSVSVLIKCQQSVSGGVSAGHYYPMAYVRDQAGVFRGLMALGYIEEAKSILDFWFSKWNYFGSLCNAEGMDNHCARLAFGNDEVEIPAYVMLCSFIYADKTGNIEYLKHLFPMLRYCFDVQLFHLADGMTEFSADETYIAGNVFPRYCMYHGSAESTMLFITSGEKYIYFADKYKFLSTTQLAHYKENLTYSKRIYKENFYVNDVLYANNPKREEYLSRPRFKIAFCDGHTLHQNTLHLSWCELSNQGYYLCPNCKNDPMPDFIESDKRYILNSINLVPVYIQSDLFTAQELDKILTPIINAFHEKGYISSDSTGTRSLGYDYGLLLYNMVTLDYRDSDKVLSVMLEILDSTGAWVEYYDNKKPYNCRCRPWESAINIEAIIEYVKHL